MRREGRETGETQLTRPVTFKLALMKTSFKDRSCVSALKLETLILVSTLTSRRVCSTVTRMAMLCLCADVMTLTCHAIRVTHGCSP